MILFYQFNIGRLYVLVLRGKIAKNYNFLVKRFQKVQKLLRKSFLKTGVLSVRKTNFVDLKKD